MGLELFRYGSSIYGGTEIIGASFDLLEFFVVAGIVACSLHALYKIIKPSKNHAAH